ncbi:MAG TPA: sorbosone dehydrogenase family protein [Luteimonas sp.]|nr:sorbosone dehydrogenase family protein [Luteimonas sp.]
MARRLPSAGLALALAVLAGGCGSTVQPLIHASNTGPDPVLPAPAGRRLLPTMDIAPAVGWKAGAMPVPAVGFAVNAFARGLAHPRTLLVLPNGDVLVAETNAPQRPEEGRSLRGKVMGLVMKRAGAGVPSADRITLLRDADGDGVAETRSVFLSGLHSPFGMALVGDALYVADTDALLRFPYVDGAASIDAPGTRVVELPAGPRNHHWTKSLAASPDGRRLYVGVGSNSNVGENGMDEEAGRALVLEVDPAAGTSRVFASGIRNPTALAFNPHDGTLWAVANERDELGNDLVPDYLTSVREGAFYGWPYSYWGRHVDARVQPQDPALVATAIAPDYALGSHVAALGLAFYEGDALPAHRRGGAFVGLHGSWNRKPPTGYQVVFVPFAGGRPARAMEPVLTGFVDADGNAQGRPVGVAIDRHGAVLVADDVGDTIWRITAGEATAPRR